MKKIVSVIILLTAFVTGCVSSGADFNHKSVYSINNNATTKDEIKLWFGDPYMTGVDNGDAAWTYNFTKAAVGSGALSKNLNLTFNSDGTVKSYTFSTSFPEEMTK